MQLDKSINTTFVAVLFLVIYSDKTLTLANSAAQTRSNQTESQRQAKSNTDNQNENLYSNKHGDIELDNRINENSDSCAQLNQVQGVVIQLLASHYENIKGIQVLTTESGNIQQDLVDIKSRMDTIDTSQSTTDERVKDLATCQSNMTEILTRITNLTSQENQRNSDQQQIGAAPVPVQYNDDPSRNRRLRHNSVLLHDNDATMTSHDNHVTNLTKTVQLQAKLIKDYDRQLRRLRKFISRLEEKIEILVSGRQNDSLEVDMTKHFMEKQKDINGNMLTRIRYLEEHLKEMTQSDAPPHNAGCPNGFQRHVLSCYRFVNLTSNWMEAENHCQSLHQEAHLVGLETAEEENFVVNFRNYNDARWTSNYIWTGATDMGKESNWSWVGTGKRLTYLNWRPGQPDIHNNNWQNCIYLRTNGHDQKWDDWHCNAAKLNYVCEINMEA